MNKTSSDPGSIVLFGGKPCIIMKRTRHQTFKLQSLDSDGIECDNVDRKAVKFVDFNTLKATEQQIAESLRIKIESYV